MERRKEKRLGSDGTAMDEQETEEVRRHVPAISASIPSSAFDRIRALSLSVANTIWNPASLKAVYGIAVSVT